MHIRILPVAYFLATKFAAYHSRGGDPRSSHDFEDIVYVTDNRLRLLEEITDAPKDVREYLQQEYKTIQDSRYREEILGCHLMDQGRLPLLEERVEQIARL